MDELILDPNALAELARIIEEYCDKQSEILEEYQSNMLSLESEWDDDQTFGEMLREILSLKQQIQQMLGQFKGFYPQFFRERAEKIAGRPIFTGASGGIGSFGGFVSGGYGSGGASFGGASGGASGAGSFGSSPSSMAGGEFVSDGKRPTSLKKTRQEWHIDGYVKTFNTPVETGKLLNSNQGVPKSLGGEGIDGFRGTCGLVSVENVLRMAGVKITEAEIVEYARTHIGKGERMLCTTNNTPGRNGGTYPEDRQAILRHFGIESTIEKYSLDTMASAVEQGRGVIVSVDANVLWHGISVADKAYHAVTVTSIQRDKATGEITGVYVCDSGARGSSSAVLVPVEKMTYALENGTGKMNVTSTIIR